MRDIIDDEIEEILRRERIAQEEERRREREIQELKEEIDWAQAKARYFHDNWKPKKVKWDEKFIEDQLIKHVKKFDDIFDTKKDDVFDTRKYVDRGKFKKKTSFKKKEEFLTEEDMEL